MDAHGTNSSWEHNITFNRQTAHWHGQFSQVHLRRRRAQLGGHANHPASPFGHSSPGAVDPNHPAILDFNSDTLALPSKDYCDANITISLNPRYADSTYSELQIAIPAELTSSDKCVSTSVTVVLGKPFFPAAMVYVDNDGIYFNAANRWALPVVLDSFNKDAMLNVPSQPATETQSATPTPTKSSSAAWNELLSPMWMVLMAVSTLFFTA